MMVATPQGVNAWYLNRYTISNAVDENKRFRENMKFTLPIIAGCGVAVATFFGCVATSPWTVSGATSDLIPAGIGAVAGDFFGFVTGFAVYSAFELYGEKPSDDDLSKLELMV